MTPAARSVYVFAIYLLVLSVGLLVAPNLLLAPFGLPPTSEVWIRVTGMLTAFLGVYYWTAARANFTLFFAATVMVRASVIVFFAIFVVAGWAERPLLLFGVIDALGAAWTWFALRKASSVSSGPR